MTPETVTKEVLKAVLNAAYVEFTLDQDGDIVVQEQCRCCVLPEPAKRRILLMSQYGFKPGVNELDKLHCSNRINKDYILVKTCVIDDRLRFMYDVSLDGGGITGRALVAYLKRFCAIPPTACADYGANLIK